MDREYILKGTLPITREDYATLWEAYRETEQRAHRAEADVRDLTFKLRELKREISILKGTK
jgi:hypothetical protein